jgi:putative ATP-dependent endonuclease of the OLD family
VKLRTLQIHNFRSIADQTISLGDYSLLIGANNAGKTNVVDALRVFYEKDLKFAPERDLPKFKTSDQESWIEVEYELTPDEVANLKAEYLIGENHCRIRKWFYPADKAKSGLLGYENEKLSNNPFYGWKNVGQAKLGKAIYIPAISRLEEHTKLTGPSALREIINDILKPIIKSSDAFTALTTEFEKFSTGIKAEKTADARSLSGLEQTVNKELLDWGVSFNLSVSSPQDEEIVKNLIKHTLIDGDLDKPMDPESFGHGLQRCLIFALIQIAASYTAPRPAAAKKDFSPDLELLLFEEPEAYLHPPRQDVLDTSLRQLAGQPGRQVIAATHSPQFVSYNADDIADLIRVCRNHGETEIAQVSRNQLRQIFEENQQIRDVIKAANDEKITDSIELEAARHFLWLNPERCSLFFAHSVIIVEGLSEQVLINYLIKSRKVETPSKGIFVLESQGKYNIARFMNLLGELHIQHAVLHDLDSASINKRSNEGLNKLIEQSKNTCTRRIETLPENLESALGIDLRDNDRWKKAARILLAVQQEKVAPEKVAKFKAKIEALVSSVAE